MARYNEYGLPTLTGTVSMTKIKNAVKRSDHPDLVPALRNIRINGQLQGCSGFLTDPITSRVIYLNTEGAADTGHRGGEVYYRNAKHTKDFSGGRNRFTTPDELVDDIIDLFASTDLT